MTNYADVELVSLLADDLPRARAFVAGQLGPLASTAEPATRLRETVLAFLSYGGSATRVAKELYVHQNTVAYRVKRAEEILGRKVNERPTGADLRADPRRSPRSRRADRGKQGRLRRSRRRAVTSR